MNHKEFGAELKKRKAPTGAITELAQAVRRKSERYIAFQAEPHSLPMLWVRVNLSNKTSREVAASYATLTSMTTDGRGNAIIMSFSDFHSILLFGYNLQPIFERLLRHEVEWVQEFHPKFWNEPESGEPWIKGIEIRKMADMKRPDTPFTLQ